MKIPYLTYADALKLKVVAENAISGDSATPPEKRQIHVPAFALLSLIEQAHSPQMGLATTKELREEVACRDGCGISRQDAYKTFDHNEENKKV